MIRASETVEVAVSCTDPVRRVITADALRTATLQRLRPRRGGRSRAPAPAVVTTTAQRKLTAVCCLPFGPAPVPTMTCYNAVRSTTSKAGHPLVTQSASNPQITDAWLGNARLSSQKRVVLAAPSGASSWADRIGT